MSTAPHIPGQPIALLKGAAPYLIGAVLAVLAQTVIDPSLNDYHAGLAMSVGINIILAVSLTIVNGFTGQFSIGHAGFLALGGYLAGSITYYMSIAIFGNAETHGGWLSEQSLRAAEPTAWLGPGDLLFAASLLAGGLFAAAMGYVVGMPSLRLKGDYLAIVTLGFGEIVRVLMQQTGRVVRPEMIAWERVYPSAPPPEPGAKVLAYPFDVIDPATQATVRIYQAVADTGWWEVAARVGGALGFSATPKYTSLFWVTLLTCVTLIVAFRIKTSTFGRALLSIREDEIAAEAMGVNTTRYKVRAFMIAAFFAGVAGGLYAHFKSMNPNEIGFSRSFDIVIMVVLGGLGSISGAAIAAVIVTLLPEYLRFLQDYRMIIWSLALVFMMLFRPTGLLGVREIWDVWKRPPRPIGPLPGGGGGTSGGGGGVAPGAAA